jgi:hypothetical protein
VKAKLPAGGHHNENIGVFDRTRYFAITGHLLDGISPKIEPRQDELNSLIKQHWPEDFIPKPTKQTATRSDIDIESILAKMFKSKNGDSIKALFDGDTGNYPSHSEADLALCCHLAYWLKDAEAIDQAFRQSGLYRKKWDRKDYRQRTIEKAIERDAIQNETDAPPYEPPEADVLNFPQSVMKGVAGDFARLYAGHLEAPAHFFFMCFLTCLGSVLSNRITLATEIAPQPRFYTLLLGSSADVRKSTVIKKVIEFFKSTIDVFSVCWGVGSAEGLQKRLQMNNILLLCLDEFKQFISKSQIKGAVLLPFVNTLFESNSYESWTKKEAIALDDVYLSVLAASTIQTYEHTWDPSFTDIGFNNRLFIVPGGGEKKFSFPSKLPISEVEDLKTRVAKLLLHASYQEEIDLTDDSKEMFQQWYLSLENSIHTKRLDQYALRLMSLLAVNRFKKVVDAEIMTDTIALCNWQLEARQLHDPIDADNETAKMEERIRRLLKRKPRTERELQQYSNAQRSGLRVYQWAKENLTKAKEIRWDKAKKTYMYCGKA